MRSLFAFIIVAVYLLANGVPSAVGGVRPWAQYGLPLDGRDIWPVITAGKPSPHEDILINTMPNSGAIRMGGWKLILNGHITANDLANAVSPPPVLT